MILYRKRIDMKLSLTNHSWVSLSLRNEFNPQLQWELEDQETSEWRLKCIKKYSLYWKNWYVEYQSPTKEVFKKKDYLGNIDYLIVKFE